MPLVSEIDDSIDETFKSEPTLTVPGVAPEKADEGFPDVDQAIDDTFAPSQSEVRKAAFVAADDNPDQYAKVIQLSKQMNVSPRFIAGGDYESLAKEAALQNTRYDEIVKNSPALERYWSNPDQLAVSKDDPDNLKSIEQSASGISDRRSLRNILEKSPLAFFPPAILPALILDQDFQNAGKTGFAKLDLTTAAFGVSERAFPFNDPKYGAFAISDAYKRSSALEKSKPAYTKRTYEVMEKEGTDFHLAMNEFLRNNKEQKNRSISDFLQEGSFTLAEFIDSVVTPLVTTDPRGVAYFQLEQLPLSLPSLVARTSVAASLLPLSPVASAIGFFATGVAAQAPVEMGDKWVSAMQRRGVDLSDYESVLKALQNEPFMEEIRHESRIGGLTVAALENMQIPFAGRRLAKIKADPKLSRVGHYSGSSYRLKPKMSDALAAGAVDVLETASAGGGAAMAGSIAAVKGDLTQVDWRELQQEFMAELGQSPFDVALGAAKKGEITTEAGTPSEAVKMGLVQEGGLTGDPISQARAESLKAIDALVSISGAKDLQELGELVKESKLTKRNLPDQVKAFISEATENDPDALVYFQIQDWDKVWQDVSLSPSEKAAELLGSADHYNDAKSTDGFIGIPLSDLAATVAPTEHWEKLIPIARMNENTPAPQEAVDFMRGLPSKIVELTKLAQGEDAARQVSVAKIGTDLRQKLASVNVKPQEIEAIVSILEPGYQNLAKQMKVDPHELYNQIGLGQLLREGISITPEKVKELIAKAKSAAQHPEYFQPAYNASQNLFSTYEMSFIGGGMGSASYGWGVYASKALEMGQTFQSGFQDQHGKSYLYKVDIPEDVELLDVDKTYSEQSEQVQKLLGPQKKNKMGRQIYDDLAAQLGSPKAASLLLAKQGIPGLKYRNETAKLAMVTKGKKFSDESFVIFNADRITMLGQENKQDELFQTPQSPKDKIEHSSEFRKWFRKSVVADNNGNPLLVYHGTDTSDIDVFYGGWWSEEKEVTAEFGSKRYAAYLSIQNPIDDNLFDDTPSELHKAYNKFLGYKSSREDIEESHSLKDKAAEDGPFRDFLIKQGYDGVRVWDDSNAVEAMAYVPFRSEQIKSVFNRGTFDPKDPRILFQTTPNVDTFYSQIQRTIEEKIQGKSASVEQVRAIIKNLKPEEVKWSGIEDFLKGKTKVDKAELLEFLRANELQIEEVVKSGGGVNDLNDNQLLDALEDKSDGPTKFSQWQIPGGENYRELLLRMPENEVPDIDTSGWSVKTVEGTENNRHIQVLNDAGKVVGGRFDYKGNDDQAISEISLSRANLTQQVNFTSSHFTETNILAHVRFNDRTDSEGKRVLFLEEIQSDWHQKGRKAGYKGDVQADGLTISTRGEPDFIGSVEFVVSDKDGNEIETGMAHPNNLDNVLRKVKLGVQANGVPDAPFRSTEAWTGLILKRMIRYAAENGYAKIAWTTGEQQVKRYPDAMRQVADNIEWYNVGDLGKKVEITKDGEPVFVGSIDEGGTVTNTSVSEAQGKHLSELIGKTMAERVVSEKEGAIKGDEFTVGGEEMKDYYDKIVPNTAKKFARKFDKSATVTDESIGDAGVVHTLEITPAIRDAALTQGFPLFQDDATIPRGYYDPNSRDVGLLKNANFSTLVHEMVGHHFMFLMQNLATSPQASPQLIEDVKALRDFVGAKEGETLTRAQQEKLAEAVETYFLEGKSPSEALRPVMARIKEWMKKIYKHLEFIGVKLTPEVRDVFNRMFASEEEIAQAATSEAMQTELTQAELSLAQAATLAKLQADVAQLGTDRLTAKMLEGHRKKERLARNKAKEDLRPEVTAKFNESAEYKAYALLADGKLPDGTALPEGVEAFKIKRDDINAQVLPEKMLSKGGVPMDQAANILGFSSADHMMSTFQEMIPPKHAIQMSLDAQVAQSHGDPMVIGTLPEEAISAMHSEKGAEKLLFEMDILAEKAGIQSEDRSILMKELRRRVEDQIGKRKVYDLKPRSYYQAEIRNAREVGKAIAKKDYEAAYEAKGRQLLSHELYRAARDAALRVERIAKFARRFQETAARQRLGKAGEDYLAQMDWITDHCEFQFVSKVRLDARTKTLSQWIAQKEASGESLGEEIFVSESLLNESNRKNYQEMTYAELDEIYSTMKQINQMAIHANKMLADEKRTTRASARDSLIKSVEDNYKKKPPEPTADEAKTRGQRLAKKGREWDVMLLKMEQLIEWLDDGDINGPWHTFLWHTSSQAQTAEYDYTRQITAKIFKAVQGMPQKLRKRSRELLNIPGILRPLTRKDAWGMFLNSGTESSRSKMIRGEHGQGEKGLTDMEIRQAINMLTKEELDFLQSTLDIIESMWPDVAKLQKELTGLAPDKLEVIPIDTAHGSYRGGYYPLIYDRIASTQGQMQLGSRIGDLTETAYTKATTPKSHTKKRIEEFSAPINYDLDQLPSHMAGVIKDLTHRKWLIDANWITSDRQIRETIREHLGDEYVTMMTDWVKRVVNDRNTNNVASMGALSKTISHFRYNMMLATLGFKVSTMTAQLVGAVNSVEVIGGKDLDGSKWFSIGVKNVLRNPRKAYKRVTALSGEMRHRFETKDRDIRDQLRLLRGKTDAASKIRELSMVAIGWMEMLVSMPTWDAAYQKALFNGIDEKHAIFAGDRAVRLSQGASGAKDLSAIVASNDNLARIVTMFYTPYSAMYSRYRDIGHTFGGIKDVPQAAMRTFLMWAVVGVLSGLASGDVPDSDDDEEAWLKWTIRNVGLGPLTTLPLIRDLANASVGQFGYNLSPLEQVGKQTAKTGKGLYDVAFGDKEMNEMYDDLFKTSAYWVGIPGSGQAVITGDYMYDLYTGDENPESMTQFFHDTFYRRRD